MNENDQLNSVLEKIQEIVKLSANGDYRYRGEPECYDKVSSSLYRKHSDIEAENFDIEVVQKEILDAAKRYTTQTDDFEILTELQHYGYNTNLIDFTTNYNIALFFACDSSPDKDGRIILLHKTNSHIVEPQSPVNRIIAQKSIFFRPPEGFVEPDETVLIPNSLKQPLLEYLHNCQNITAETIYNDLHGFIRYQNVHQSAYAEFFVGLTYQEKDYSKAIEHYSNAIKLNPQMAGAYCNRGLAYSNNNEVERAIKDYNKAIEMNPEFAEAYCNRGLAYSNNNEVERAIKDYNKAIEMNPEFAEAYFGRAIVYGEKEEFEPAIDDLNKAIELNPEFAGAYCNRGLAYSNNNEVERAIKDYNKAIELNPEFTEAYLGRAIVYGEKEEFEPAIDDYNKAIELNPEFTEAYLGRGFVYFLKGEVERAIKDYNKAIELNPESAEAYLGRGIYWLPLQKWQEARSDLTVAKNKGADIIKEFCDTFKNVAEFEQKYDVKLPEDIAAMLTQE